MRILAIGNTFNSFSIKVDNFCHKDSEVSINAFYSHYNGAASVVAAIAALLGYTPTLITKIPERNQLSEFVVALGSIGVDISQFVLTQECAENTLVTIYDKHHDRNCYAYTPNELAFHDISSIDYSNYDVVFFCCLSAIIVSEVFSKCRLLDKTLSVCLPSGLYCDYFDENKLLINSDYFFLNRGEIIGLTNKEISPADIPNCLKSIDFGKTTIITTMGKDGILYKESGGEIRSFDVDPISHIMHPEGAGDAFATGFITSLLKKHSIADCCKIGHECSKIVLGYNSILSMIRDNPILRR